MYLKYYSQHGKQYYKKSYAKEKAMNFNRLRRKKSLFNNTNDFQYNNFNSQRYDQRYGQINGSMVLGFLLSAIILFLGVVIGGNFTNFISISGLIIVLGGIAAAMLVNFSFDDIKKNCTLYKIGFILHRCRYKN